MDLHAKQSAIRIHHGVALAAKHLLAGVIAAWTTSFSGLDALAVNHNGRRASLTSDSLTILHDQVVGDGLPDATIAPGREPAITVCRGGKQGGSIR